jgi:hypothetical protein
VTYPRTPAPDPTAGRLPPKPYRYSKYPAVDRLLDLLAENGLSGAAISCCTTRGQVYLSVMLPGHRHTDEYCGVDVQAAALRWLNGEAETFAEQCVMHAAEAA